MNEHTPQLPRKKFALVPSERERICVHHHVHYRGEVPCTGPLVCSMCGTLFHSQEEVTAARETARRARRTI